MMQGIIESKLKKLTKSEIRRILEVNCDLMLDYDSQWYCEMFDAGIEFAIKFKTKDYSTLSLQQVLFGNMTDTETQYIFSPQSLEKLYNKLMTVSDFEGKPYDKAE